MVKVDLITGFLGAGKTTFLLRYARFLIESGMKIGIMVYDHGAVNVDMPMLQELRGEQCELESIIGGCDADSHRRRFRTKLIAMGMSGYDRILIEPSGIFDMDEFFDVLNEPPLDQWFEPGSVITIVDARLEEDLPKEADFFLASQAAWAGKIILSRTQLASEVDITHTLQHLERAAGKIHSEPLSGDLIFPAGRILAKNWDELTKEDFTAIMNAGYFPADYVKTIAGHDITFSSLSFLDLPLTRAELQILAETLFRDIAYGSIFRVKGFLHENTHYYQVNATRNGCDGEEVPETRCAVIIVGCNLNEKAIRHLFERAERGVVHP